MDIAGIVFICVIFAISLALVAYCCLKFCSSEEKYERNPENGNRAPILPTSTTNCTVRENPSVYPPTILPYTASKSSPLDVERNEPRPKLGFNLSSPPKPGFIVGGIQFAAYNSIILPSPPKPPPIGFGYPPDVVSTDTARPQCPYPTAKETKRRTPSPNPTIHKTSYSPRTSSYFSENAGPFSGISFSSDNLNNCSKPLPPSYAEAMREHKLPVNSAKGPLPKCQPYR